MGNGNEAQTEGAEGNPPVALSPATFNLNGYDAIQSVFANGAYNAPLGPTGYTALPYHQKWGSEQQFSLGVQHEFPGASLLSVSYVGTLGRHLARGRQLDQIPIGVGTVNAPSLAGITGNKCGFDAVCDKDGNILSAQQLCDGAGNCDVQTILMGQEQPNTFFLPYTGYRSIFVKENTAVSSYNALQVNFRHQVGRGLTLQAVYTWSHALDDSSSTYYQSGVDDYNLRRWKATSSLNRAQVLTMNYIYELPFFKQSSNSAVKSLLGGWEVSGITSLFTGQPIDFGCGVAGYGTGIGGSVRCNTLGPLKKWKHMDNDPEFGPTPAWFDPNVFAQPTLQQLRADGKPGMFGYMDRNPLTGPGRNNWDMALLKNFSLPWFGGEHSTIQFRWETFNTWNHPQWQYFNAGCDGSDNPDGSKAFGRGCMNQVIADPNDSTKTKRINAGQGQINSAWASRIMQFGLKFIF